MAGDDFLELGTEDLSAGVHAGSPASADVVAACLDRIAHRDPELHAFVKVFAAAALDRARALDAEMSRGQWRGPLHGLPVAIKDLADIEGEVTGFGSRCYSSLPARQSAGFIEALETAGAVIIGKTQMVEFAYGSWGTNYALGTPVNPATPDHCAPGGSSSGSAVAVAAGMVPLAIGSDTGGSVRIPASLCGVAGMKPSHGLTSLQGVAPLSATLDTIGPLARDVAGLKYLADAMRMGAMSDESSAAPLRFRRLATADLLPAHAGILGHYEDFMARLQDQGNPVEDLALPLPLAECQRRCGRIMAHDAYRTLHGIIDDHRLPLDPWVRGRVAMGRDIDDKAHEQALRQRRAEIAAFLDGFDPGDALVLPTTPFPTRPVAEIDEREIPMSRFTRFANYLDLTAVSLPLWQVDGAPAGIQFVMRHGQDDRLLDLLARSDWAA